MAKRMSIKNFDRKTFSDDAFESRHRSAAVVLQPLETHSLDNYVVNTCFLFACVLSNKHVEADSVS